MSRLPLSLSPLLVAAAVLAGCASTPAERAHEQAAAATTQQKLDARLAGYTPGQPVDCINDYPTSHSEAFGSKILYSFSRDTLYVNDTTGGCESMQNGDYLVTVSNSGRLCSGDIGRTFQPDTRVPTGSCALGRFTPYQRK